VATKKATPQVPAVKSTSEKSQTVNRVKKTDVPNDRLKEIVGRAEDTVELPDGAPIEALFTHYGADHPELARFRASLVASRNQEFAAWNTPLHSGDEVAFLPPVSGG